MFNLFLIYYNLWALRTSLTSLWHKKNIFIGIEKKEGKSTKINKTKITHKQIWEKRTGENWN